MNWPTKVALNVGTHLADFRPGFQNSWRLLTQDIFMFSNTEPNQDMLG